MGRPILGALLSTPWRALRRRVLTPNTSNTRLDVRGFHQKNPAARDLLESVGRNFLAGFGSAAEAGAPHEVQEPLNRIEKRFRGFAYEGAAMGFAIRDALSPTRRSRAAEFIAGCGEPHIYMAYIGIGWAMARVPRLRWSAITPDAPLLRWLVLDGYGFHQAYFRTQRYVHDRYREERFGWPKDSSAWYAGRAIDQGIGRALWFVGGTDPEVVTTLADRFPEPRRADLYSGIGLAATYAGGAEEAELRALWRHAEPYRPNLAQGSAFAASARKLADLLVPHNDVATQVFCGLPARDAAALSDRARPTGPAGRTPAYEVWRHTLTNEFVSSGRV
ncbi:DUF1702 family protein [Micromonospora sp. NPDC051543]|uniref:DUF1702 family protein n=1 Tax=Micromonospora sp. NPDC051543 TaxID=3364287 RepID=UPI0037975B23